MRAAQLSYRLNRWNVRLRNVRLTSTRWLVDSTTWTKLSTCCPGVQVHGDVKSFISLFNRTRADIQIYIGGGGGGGGLKGEGLGSGCPPP